MRTATTRQGQAVVGVARRLLGVGAGEQIPTVTEIGVGSGTVQAALRALREAGAISLCSHGHLGTTLVRWGALASGEHGEIGARFRALLS
jgi:hypothetical protein